MLNANKTNIDLFFVTTCSNCAIHYLRITTKVSCLRFLERSIKETLIVQQSIVEQRLFSKWGGTKLLKARACNTVMKSILCAITFLLYLLISDHSLPFSQSSSPSQTELLFACFCSVWPQWGGEGWAGLLPPDNPMLADLYCWLIRASPINTTALLHSCSPTLGLVLCVTLTDFVLIVVYFSNGSWQWVIFEIPKIQSFVFFFLSSSFFLCASFSLPTNPLSPRTRSVPWPVWIIHRALSMTLKEAPSLQWPRWWWNASPERSVSFHTSRWKP